MTKDWPIVGPEGEQDTEAWKKLVKDMYEWGTDLQEWGKRVRCDIVALEAQRDLLAEKLGMSKEDAEKQFADTAQARYAELQIEGCDETGDPEDPPPPPWKPK